MNIWKKENEDQMKAYSDNKETYGYYGYDDAGQRMYKVTANNTLSRINALGDNVLEVEKLMLYPNGYININQNGNYTKHYYAEDARIASKIGSGYEASITAGTDSLKMVEALELMQKELGEVTNDTIENISCNFTQITHLQGEDSNAYENALYFYHGNHLSSTQLITDMNANVKQAVLYTPWGTIISEYRSDWMLDTIPRFLWQGKERDEESGMDYFEARYYSSDAGTFRSRDPKFEEYFWLSPYCAFGNNPVIYIDPDGREKIPALNPGTTTNYATARKGIRNYTRNIGVIHLWGHGNKNTIETYNEKNKEVKFLTSPKKLEAFLTENSAVYRNNNQEGKESKTSILVLHSCSTGESDGIAQQASKDLNLLVVAPTDKLTMTSNTDGTDVTEDVNNEGGWAVYYKGEKMETFKGSTKPLFDNPDKIIEKYEKMYQEKNANPEN